MAESQSLIDLSRARIVGANREERDFSGGANPARQLAHNRGAVAVPFKFRQCAYRTDFAVAAEVQAQAAHRHQVAVLFQAEETAEPVQPWREFSAGPRGFIQCRHLREVVGRELHHFDFWR